MAGPKRYAREGLQGIAGTWEASCSAAGCVCRSIQSQETSCEQALNTRGTGYETSTPVGRSKKNSPPTQACLDHLLDRAKMLLPDGSEQSLESVWKGENPLPITQQMDLHNHSSEQPCKLQDVQNYRVDGHGSVILGSHREISQLLSSPSVDSETPQPRHSYSPPPVSRLLTHSAGQPLSVHRPDGRSGHGVISKGTIPINGAQNRPQSAAAIMSSTVRRSPGSPRYPVAPASLCDLYEGNSQHPASALCSTTMATTVASLTGVKSNTPMNAREALVWEKDQRLEPRQRKWPPGAGSITVVGGGDFCVSTLAAATHAGNDKETLIAESSAAASFRGSPSAGRRQGSSMAVRDSDIVKARTAGLFRPRSAFPSPSSKRGGRESAPRPASSMRPADIANNKSMHQESPHAGLFKTRL